MKTLLKSAMTIAGWLVVMAKAQACQFYWHYYGNDAIKGLLDAQLSPHITNDFCSRYTKQNEVVFEFDSFVMPKGGCVGYANASLRPKGSKVQQAKVFASAHTSPQCQTIGEANSLAVQAALEAVDNLMSSLGNYQMTR